MALTNPKTGLVLLTLVTALQVQAAHAQDDDAQRKALCAPHVDPAFEVPPIHGPLTPQQLKDCDEVALYYGLGHSPDFAAAQQCGYAQRAAHSSPVSDIFYGAGVLSMIYANGKGVPRDIDLAERFVCENQWTSPYAVEVELKRLDALRQEASFPAQGFELCDAADSTPAIGSCAWIHARIDDEQRRIEIAKLSAGWSPAARRALSSLQSAYKAFVDARSDQEVDQSGTGRAVFVLDEAARQDDQLLINLHSFARGAIPPAGAAEASAADTEMAEELDRLRAGFAAGKDLGTIKFDGIEQTQAAWLKARQAWLDLAAVAWPSLDPNRLRWRLTRQRIGQIKGLERYF